MQRPAKPCTPVRFRPWPPISHRRIGHPAATGFSLARPSLASLRSGRLRPPRTGRPRPASLIAGSGIPAATGFSPRSAKPRFAPLRAPAPSAHRPSSAGIPHRRIGHPGRDRLLARSAKPRFAPLRAPAPSAHRPSSAGIPHRRIGHPCRDRLLARSAKPRFAPLRAPAPSAHRPSSARHPSSPDRASRPRPASRSLGQASLRSAPGACALRAPAILGRHPSSPDRASRPRPASRSLG